MRGRLLPAGVSLRGPGTWETSCAATSPDGDRIGRAVLPAPVLACILSPGRGDCFQEHLSSLLHLLRGKLQTVVLRQFRNEGLLGLALLGLTIAAGAFLARDLIGSVAQSFRAGEISPCLQQAAFASIIAVMLYGSLVYQVARLGHFRRSRRHRPASRWALVERFATRGAPVAILVPAYREEQRVVRQTLLSAALQDYPNRRVVLLIDDPPESASRRDAALLDAARRLPGLISELLEKPARHLESARDDFEARVRSGASDPAEETRRLAELHAETAAWFESRESNEAVTSHTDRQFVEMVFRAPARSHLARALEFERRELAGDLPTGPELAREFHALAARFRTQVASFERKGYENLSHEPNKAMNLNSYIALLGGSYRRVERDGRLHLEPAAPAEADIHVPAAEFVVTLDADSLLATDYVLRLVDVLERPGNERVAVAQTPYSAVPGPPGSLERIAGATTDIQYIIHQGFSSHGAAYWVGANALLRTAALQDIRAQHVERGFEISRFIQDRTVIEDTESSVDLVARGWTLCNYPERMAYSATPPDFGALAVQRHRWANGGLIILPKLLRHLRRQPWSPGKLAEGVLRIHYLTSIAGVNLGLLLLLLVPFEHGMRHLWLALAALPYFALYARDLIQIGYRTGDFARAYALNLLLLPVNLAGVLASLRQALTGRRDPFARTPKVADRTAVPRRHVAFLGALLVALTGVVLWDLAEHRWSHAGFSLVNGALLAYGLVRFVGVRQAIEDLRRSP